MSGHEVSGTLRIVLVRHGETLENAAGIVQGHSSGHLSKRGQHQAETIADLIRGEHVDAAYSSDLKRARDTAQVLVRHRPGLRVALEPRLREQHLGRLEGQSLRTLVRRMRRQRENWTTFNPPDGELHATFRSRIRSVFQELVRKHKGRTILVVTHFGVIQHFFVEFGALYTERGRMASVLNGTAIAVEMDESRIHRLTTYSSGRDDPAVCADSA